MMNGKLKRLTRRQALRVAARIPPKQGWPQGVAVPMVNGQPIYSPKYERPNPNNTGVAAAEIRHREKQWRAFQARSQGSPTYAQDLREFIRQEDLGIGRKVTDHEDVRAAQPAAWEAKYNEDIRKSQQTFRDWWSTVIK